MPRYEEYPESLEMTDNDIILFLDAETSTTRKILASNAKKFFSTGQSTSRNWTPIDTFIHVWLDFSDNIVNSIDSNNRLFRTEDKSGYNRNFTQSSETLRPISSTGLNNKRIITFDGVNDFIRAESAFNLGNSVDLYFVARYPTATRRALFDTAPNQPNVGRQRDGLFEWWNLDPQLPISTTVNEFDILCFRYQLNSNRLISFSINGGNFTTASSGNTGGLSWGQLTLGTVNTSEQAFNGSIGEFIATPNLITPTFQKMVGYLAHNWNLTSKLPSSHPFKNTPPTV